MKILIVNGVNLNMLGKRETDLYGNETLKDLENRLNSLESGADLHFFQSNSEEEIIEKIHSQKNEKYDYGIFNFGAHTHTNIAIRDAILSVKLPFYEVHISNIHKRESFRHNSYVSQKSTAVIAGFGVDGYKIALEKMINLCSN